MIDTCPVPDNYPSIAGGTGNMIAQRQVASLKLSFMIGVIADFLVGVNWLLIAVGYNVPSLMTGAVGEGGDYRLAMYISTMFMFSWVLILAWGYMKPVERRGLLMISASMLALSIIAELLCYRGMLPGTGLAVGITMRILIITKFTASYTYSLRKLD
jgi:hypothetical protein